MRKNVVCLMMILLMASSMPVNTSAGPSDDIPTNAQNTGVHDTLVELLIKADLVSVLQGTGPFTVFAPTDTAFANAGIDPDDFNTQEEIDELTDILLYHVYDGFTAGTKTTDIGLECAELEMVNGDYAMQSIDPLPYSESSRFIIEGANVTVADVESSNGVIHVIDKVMIPGTSHGTITQNIYCQRMLTGLGDFDTLYELLVKTELHDVLQEPGPWTIFAPTDTAFANAGIDPDDFNTAEELETLTNILLQHVITGELLYDDITDEMIVEAANEEYLRFCVGFYGGGFDGSTPVIDRFGKNCPLSSSNYSEIGLSGGASNGIIYEISEVLFPPEDIVSTAENETSVETFVEAITQAELIETLQGEGPFTVFAPTDAAFVAANIDPADSIWTTQNAKDTLSNTLLYHVIPGDILSTELEDCQLSTSANNKPLSFTIDGSSVMINDANIVRTDIFSNNGIIHYIDKVLTPTDTPRDILRIAQCSDDHNDLVVALLQAGLADTFDDAITTDSDFTLFAPTNDAFTAKGINLATISQADLEELLKYHVVSGIVPSSAVTDCMSSLTLSDNSISFTVDNEGGVIVNDANVTQADSFASNGVIHVIDKVLDPNDIPVPNIPRVVQCSGFHNTLFNAVIDAGLLDALSGDEPLTLFAPEDAAFDALGIDLSTLSQTELADVLKYHVVAGEVPSSAVTDCMPADTLNGNPLSFTVNSSTGVVMVNDANVTFADSITSNGVIHVIDKVLMPTATPNDIPRTAQCTGIHNTLVTAVIQGGLLETLQGEGPFTVFAPTDQAFTDAGIDLSAVSQSDLADILTYHVVSGAVPASAVTECMSADSVNGNPLSFTVDGGVMVNGANVTLADVNTSNGIIHVIDKVLLPTATPNDIPRTAQCTGIHDTLVTAVIQGGLLETLQGEGPFTVFAPTDQAFADAGIDLAAVSQSDLADILTYHVVSGAVPASAVTDCMSADTVNGNPLSFTVDGGVMVNGANVTLADVNTSNGVIHVIDKVLLPTATPNDIPRTAQCTGIHNTLVTAVIQAGLLETLQGEGTFTVFAPTDQAFTDAGIDLSTLNQSQLSDILLYHVLDSSVLSSAITDGLEITMVNGDNATFSTTSGVMINGANVTLADVATSNGVVHVIDKVLLPPVEITDDSESSTDDSESSTDDDSDNLLWIIIGVVLVLVGGAGALLFVRNRNSAASASKDFSSQGLMNQLESVDQTAYIGQSSQPMAQQQAINPVAQQPTVVQTVEVIPQPVVAEPVVLNQWTDESGYTWRKMDDGSTLWWTGSEWQKYG